MRRHNCATDCWVAGGPPPARCRLAVIGPGQGRCCAPPGRPGPMAMALLDPENAMEILWPEGWGRMGQPKDPQKRAPGPGPAQKREPADILIF